MTPLTQAITSVLCILILVLPRKLLLAPFVMGIFFVPADQCLVVGGANFFVSQIMVISAILRMAVRGEMQSVKINTCDVVFMVSTLYVATVYVLYDMSTEVLVFRCGRLLESFGAYFIFRVSTRSWADVSRFGTLLAAGVIMLLPFVVKEHLTANNPFAILGRSATALRDGRLRCSSSFPHPIMLGSFAAALCPLFFGCLKATGRKVFWGVPLVVAVYFVIASASSGPALSLVGGVLFLASFRLRKYAKEFVIGAFAVLCLLSILMNAPVWFVIARINVVPGSTGWHRANLVQQFADHFGEWWLLGARGPAIVSWGVYAADVTNHYLALGANGGFLGMALFIGLLALCINALRKYSRRPIPLVTQWLVWGVCVSLITHCISFMSVTYFGQISLLLYWSLAVAAFACGNLRCEFANVRSMSNVQYQQRHNICV